MPKTQRNREKAEAAKDWIRFKFSRYLWVRFLQKCVDSGTDVDDMLAQIISGWCWLRSQQTTEATVQDKDDLEKEFALLLEDLKRRSFHYEKRDQLVRRARELRKQLSRLRKAQ